MKYSFKPVALIVSVFSLFLFGCGETTSSNENETVDELLTTSVNEIDSQTDDVIEIEEPTPMDDEDVIPNEDWQINNYANHLMGEKVWETYDDIPEGEEDSWFYQEIDLKGGFASVVGPVEGWKEFVLWRTADGNDLIGEMTVGCGPACDYNFLFHKGKGAEITTVAEKTIFPIAEMEKHRVKQLPLILEKYEFDYPEDWQWVYNFPQEGTGMQVDLVIGADEMQIPMLLLSWDKSKFNVETLLFDI